MQQETRIGRIQLHTKGKQGDVTRLGITRQLHQTRLHPSHLPSSAILVIRRLAHETPFGNRVADGQRWSRQLEQQVATLARQAVRPAQQTTGHLAQSVLFLDPVELLVCFTRDALAQRSTWYWQELFPVAPTHSVGDQLVAGWIAYPEALPATVVALPPATVIRAIQQLQPSQVRLVVTCLHQHFALADAIIQSQTLSGPVQSKGQADGEDQMFRRHIHPPWQQWLPVDSGSSIPPMGLYLLGLCYTLVNALEQARAAQFMTDASAWIEQQEQSVARIGHTATAATETSDYPEPKPWMARSKHGQPVQSEHKEDVPDVVDSQTVVTKQTTANELSNDMSQELSSEPSELGQQQPDQFSWEPEANGAVATTEDNALAAEQPESIWTDPTGIDTALGGAFYLVNLLTWLQREEQLPDHEPTNLWLAVAVLMAELLGERRRRYQSDPLWEALADLAHIQRTSLWTTLDDTQSNELAPTVDWWRRQYHRSIRDHLVQRLTGDSAALAAFFIIPAKLIITNTHIDVRMALDAINIDTRRCGLDRSPGWLPAFGYIVTFVFG